MINFPKVVRLFTVFLFIIDSYISLLQVNNDENVNSSSLEQPDRPLKSASHPSSTRNGRCEWFLMKNKSSVLPSRLFMTCTFRVARYLSTQSDTKVFQKIHKNRMAWRKDSIWKLWRYILHFSFGCEEHWKWC